MSRIYHCKFGCGFHRSRKAQVVVHEERCKFGVIDRILEDNKTLNKKLIESDTIVKDLQQKIEVLTKQVSGLMKRKKKEDDDEALYNFKWQKDYRFKPEFFEKVMNIAPNMSSAIETMLVLFLEKTPIFYKITKKKNSLQIKGVVGKIKAQSIGVDNIITTIPFTTFYTVVMDMLIEELLYYHYDIAIMADEDLKESERETNDERETRLKKALNVLHYEPVPHFFKDAQRHNKLYRICRGRTIDIMYETMKKQIKSNSVLVV